jgi:N-acetylglucosaminyl-diphospho-decaprenol L-rhamnosyltransferase
VTQDPPAVSVVVVSYNTRELLLECITSLAPIALPHEVIVVDNASADGSAEAVRTQAPHARLIENHENVGFSRANNAAIRTCRARYVLILNSDARVRADTVETLVQILDSRPDVGIVGPRTIGTDGRIQVSFGPDLTPLNEWRQRRLVRGVEAGDPDALRQAEERASREFQPAWVSGSCLLARRELLDRLGGFDEGFFLYEEDVDLCVRVRQAGFKVLFTPATEVVHHRGRSMETARQRARQAYRDSHVRFYRKHNGLVDRLLLRLWMLLSQH